MMTRSSHRRSTTSSWCEEKAAPRAPAPGGRRDDVDGERIETRERLIEDQHLGSCTRAAAICARCWLPSERLDVVQALAETELDEQGLGALCLRLREAVQPRG
jgi:hypothetical protein